MFRRKSTGKHPNKSVAASGGRNRPRAAKHDWTRHIRFEALEDRYLLSAAPTPLGSLFEVNPSVPIDGGSNAGVAATNAAGDTVVLWEYGFYGIYAQRFNAAGAAQGSDFKVASMSQGVDPSLHVAMDSAGDFVVAWQSDPGSTYGIYAQLVSATNVDEGSAFAVDPLASTAQFYDTQTGPSVAMDAAGDFVIAWQSPYAGSGSGIYAQRYNAAGNAQGSQFRVGDATAAGNYPAVAMDSAGDFVVTWSGSMVGSSEVSAQLYNADGTTQGSEFQVNTYTASIQLSQSVAMDSAGDFVVTWTSIGQDGSAGGIYAQRYSTGGTAQGSEFQVNTYTTGDQNYAGVAMDSAGDFVVAWQSTGTGGTGDGIFAQAYTAAGNASGSEFQVNTYTTSFQLAPVVAMDGSGDFLIAWANEGVPMGAVDARAYSGNFAASAIGSEFQVNTYTTGDQNQPKVATDAAGDYVVVWQSQGQDGSGYGIYAQRYNSAGTAQGSEFQVNTYTAGDQEHPAVAMDSAGDFVIIWQSYGQNGTGSSISAQRYNSAGVAQGSEFQANSSTNRGVNWPAGVAMDSEGDFVVAWNNYELLASNVDNWDSVYVQRFNASGVAQGSAFQVQASGVALIDEFAVAMDSAGDFVIAWQQLGGSVGYGIYAERFNAAGVAQGSGFLVIADSTNVDINDMSPTVAMDSAGDFVVAWDSFSRQAGDVRNIYAQRYSSTGVAQGSEFLVNTYTGGNEEKPSLAMDSAGDFVVAWSGNNPDGDGTFGIYARAYGATGVAHGSEFQINTIAGEPNDPSVAMDAAGDFVVAWQSAGDQDGSGYGVYAQRYGFPVSLEGSTLTINGATLTGPLELEFTSPTTFSITFNGTTYSYDTSTVSHVIFNGVPGAFSEVIFDDGLSTDDYAATQSLSSTTLVRTDGVNFEFDANGVGNFYAYVSGSTSTATVNVSIGSGSNFYVSAADGGYSYIADPVNDIYSELSGFSSQTVTGSGGSTYAYVYSTSNATFVGDPNGSTLTVGGATSTFSNFTQLYAVGAGDGTDTMTLQTEGGSFVDTPGFAYVAGTFNNAPFLIGALFAANVTGQATNPTDSAFFYNYPGDTFDGGVGTSTLTGNTNGLTSFTAFVAQATGFQAVIDEESGNGTDTANLNSPGNAVFTSTPTASTLVVGGVTVLTVMTSVNSNGTFVPVPSQVTVTGVGVTSDVANLYDESGTNAIVAQGSTATLTRPTNSVSVSQFGQVNALQTQGSIDDLDPVNIDFALQTVGNWTSD